MRRVGESVYYKEFLKPQLNEIVGEESYKLEHIVGRRKLVTHTDRVDDTQLEAVTALLERVLPQNVEVEQYNHNIEIPWKNAGKYAECTDGYAICNTDPEKAVEVLGGYKPFYYTTDFCSDGTFGYPLPKLQDTLSGKYGGCVFENVPAKTQVYDLPSLTRWSGFNHNVETLTIKAPLCKILWCFNASKLKNLIFIGDNLTSLTEGGYFPKLENVEMNLHNITQCIGFQSAILNKESALRIINSIPAFESGNHPIQIGIHIDHQNDAEIAEAIAAAESRKWSFSLRWNGTPTASASVGYSLRKPSIYAKVDEMEMPDGTTERVLDWGHYVTNPEDYQEFSSLEKAREHFGISEDSEELNNSEQ